MHILPDMLTITQDLHDEIVAHARKDHPDEACGVIAAVSAGLSPPFDEFDSGDLLKLYREMDDRDEEPVVIYHSHTATEAYPSRTDVGYASGPAADPRTHYVLVSTRHHERQTGLAGDDVEFRSFRIVDGEVREEEVEVVESYLFGHSPTTVVYD